MKKPRLLALLLSALMLVSVLSACGGSADTAPGNPTAQDFIDNISGQATMDSAILLLHSSGGHEETVKAVPEIIRILRERGYTFGVVTPMTPQPW